MKVMKHITKAMMLAALLGVTLGSCTDDLIDAPELRSTALMLCPMLNESPTGGQLTLTRNDAIATTDENKVAKMDIYIFNNTSGDLVKSYHKSSAATMAGADNLLENNWPDFYSLNTTYDVYVIANSPVTNMPEFANRDELKAWTLTNDGGIVSPDLLLMDGHQTWTPTSATDQRLTNINLTRAAAKLELTVKIGADLATAMQAASQQLQRPVFRPVNYNVNTMLECKNSGVDATRDLKIYDGWLYDGTESEDWVTPAENDSFTLTAYSYSFSWTAAEASLKLPKMLVSFGIKENGATVPSYHYYLLPMVNITLGNTDLKRNYIYKAIATLKGYGSTEEVEENEDVDINYQVIDWSQGEEYEASLTAPDVHFMKVLPDNPAIHGGTDSEHNSITLFYSASHEVRLKTGSVSSYFIDKNGTEVTFTDGRAAGLSGTGTDGHYSLTFNENDHTIVVASRVPNNKAVKYIKFTLEMIDENGNVLTDPITSQPYSKDVIVSHFPENYVMHIDGWWSSRYNPGSSATTRQYTDDWQAAGWSSYDGVENVVTYGEVEDITRSQFTAAVPGNGTRRYYNTTESGYLNDGYVYYGNGREWSSVLWSDDYDWREGLVLNINYYRFQYYHRRSVTTQVRYYRDVVSGSLTGNWVNWSQATGNIIANIKSGNSVATTTSQPTSTNPRIYQAKVYLKADNGTWYTWWIKAVGGTTSNHISSINSTWNNRMYVIITKAVDPSITLAHPYIPAGQYFSTDDVVSPGFMVASNLGNLTLANYPGWNTNNEGTNGDKNMSNTAAKEHCASYLETSREGKMYYGWRLPTSKELDLIAGYQNPTNGATDVMDKLLPGKGYYDLSGKPHQNPGTYESNSYGLRCVRDLTPEDVRYINGEMTDEERTAYLRAQ